LAQVENMKCIVDDDHHEEIKNGKMHEMHEEQFVSP
jgi:hypothetical protein